jgi:hypothetical protein
MSVDRPEATTPQKQAGGNGHERASSATFTDEVDVGTVEPVDRTETLTSPGFGDGPPIVVPPAPPAQPVPFPPPVPSVDDRLLYDRPPQPRSRRRTSGEGGEARWVTHRLRHLSLWSVFKLAGLFYVCLFFSLLVATVLLWNVGRASGAVDQAESFVSGMGSYGECVPEEGLKPGTEFDRDEDCKQGNVRTGTFELEGGVVFRSALVGGLLFVVAATIATVLLTILFNLLNEITGGLRYTLIREPNAVPSGVSVRRRTLGSRRV